MGYGCTQTAPSLSLSRSSSRKSLVRHENTSAALSGLRSMWGVLPQGSRPGPGVWQKSALPNLRFDRDRFRAALRERSVECGAPAPLCFPAKRRRESIRELQHARTPSANESGAGAPHSKDGCAVKCGEETQRFQIHLFASCTCAKLQPQGSRPGLNLPSPDMLRSRDLRPSGLRSDADAGLIGVIMHVRAAVPSGLGNDAFFQP